MAHLSPYLNLPGNTEEAFNFYKSVFGGEFVAVVRFKDTPEAERVPEHEKDKLMHISLMVGKTVLMGTDALESMGHNITNGNNYHISVGTDTQEEAERIFNGLSADAKYVMVPFSKMFWGAYFGMFTDKYGVQWMVNFDENHRPEQL